MKDLLIYLVAGELIFLCFFLGWRSALVHQMNFKLNRYWLLTGILASLGLPLIPLFMTSAAPFEVNLPLVVIQAVEGRVDASTSELVPMLSNTWFSFYMIGGLIFLGRLVFALGKVLRFFSRSRKGGDGIRTYSVKEGNEAFSFMNTVFLPEQLQGKEKETIIQHEKVHIRQRHSIDILLLECWKLLHWFSPLAAFYKKAIKVNHEFLVDAEMTNTFIAREDYAQTLIRAHQSKLQISLVHSFSNKSSIKNRLKMMYKKKNKAARILQLMAIPFFMAAILVACTKVDTAEVVTGEEVLKSAEVMPEFPGGMDAFMTYMMEGIEYPESQKENGIEGKVMINFTIAKSGAVQNAQVTKSLGAEFDKNALQIVEEMPNWTPGSQDGKTVAVEMTLPVKYVMEN